MKHYFESLCAHCLYHNIQQGRLAFGTATGSFRVYEWDVNQWVEVASGPSLGSSVTSISLSDDAQTVVVGLANREVRVYDLT